MVNRPKIKGTAAETAFVGWLNVNGFPFAERAVLRGSLDQGDVTGCPGLMFEVKDHATWKMPAWMSEVEVQVRNRKAGWGFLVIKPPGIGLSRPGDWAMAMRRGELEDLTAQTEPYNRHLTYSGNRINELRLTFKHVRFEEFVVITQRGEKDISRHYALARVSSVVHRLRLLGYGNPVGKLL